MKFRLRAFGLHLAGSAGVLALVLGSFYGGWYRWPGWYLSGVLSVVLVMCLVDVALGPSLTLIVANPHKARSTLKRDIAIIVAVQAAALIYGTVTLWMGRPLYYTYSNKSLDMVQASDLEADEIARALKDNPAFAPHWYSGVRWVWAPLPADLGRRRKYHRRHRLRRARTSSTCRAITSRGPRAFRSCARTCSRLALSRRFTSRRSRHSPGRWPPWAYPRRKPTRWCCGARRAPVRCWRCSTLSR